MEFNSELLCKIPIKNYRVLTGCNASYEGTDRFDEECGIRYYSEQIKDKKYEDCFYFNIIDKKKYLIAKLKYGI